MYRCQDPSGNTVLTDNPAQLQNCSMLEVSTCHRFLQDLQEFPIEAQTAQDTVSPPVYRQNNETTCKRRSFPIEHLSRIFKKMRDIYHSS